MGTQIRATPWTTRPKPTTPVSGDIKDTNAWLYVSGWWNALQDRLDELERDRAYVQSRFPSYPYSQYVDMSAPVLRGFQSQLSRISAEEQRIQDELRGLASQYPGLAAYANTQRQDYVSAGLTAIARSVANGDITPEEGARQREDLLAGGGEAATELRRGSQEAKQWLRGGEEAAYEAPVAEDVAPVTEGEPAVTDVTGIYDPSYVSPYDQWQMQFSEQEAERQWRQTQFEQQLQMEQWAWQQRQAQQQYQLSQQQMGAGMMPSLLGLQQEAWNARRQYELPQGTQYLPTFEPGGLMSSLAQSGGWGFTPREPLNLPIPGQGVGPAMRWAQGMMGY